MHEVKFRKNWIGLGIGIIAGSALSVVPVLFALWNVIFWGTSRQVAKADSRWTWAFIASFFLAAGIYFSLLFIRIYSIKFTDEGIWQRRALGWHFVAWKSITYAESQSYLVKIYKHKETMDINLMAFVEWDKVVEYIRGQISTKVFQ
jgi:hypothetical protein